MINYQDTKYSVVQYEKHLNDGVRLYVKGPTTAVTAKLTITTQLGDEYDEVHTMHNGKTIFDLSEYFLESMPLGYKRLFYAGDSSFLRFAQYNEQDNTITNAVAPSKVAKAISLLIDGNTIELTADDLDVVYGYTKFEPSSRFHLFNPNFECVAEFTPMATHASSDDIIGYTLFGLCFNRNNGGEIDWYRHPTGSKGYVRQVCLNTYWDDRYTSEGIMLDFVTNETATATISYMVDKRKDGAYLRFLDSDGYLQQILLDIESQENTYEDGDLLVRYNGGERYYTTDGVNAICQGHGNTAQRTETNCLHCSLTNMPKALTTDLKALALSPIVLMYRGKDDDGNLKWERVRVVPNGTILEETKKATISAKFDIYPIFENAQRV